MAAVPERSCGFSVFFLVSALSLCCGLLNGGRSYRRKLSVQLNPGFSSAPPGGDLLHVRAVGGNDTLHFLFCSLGAPTLLLVHTNTSSSTVKVNWTQFLDPYNNGGLEVEPESSILYSTAVVFSRLLEYEDINNTAHPSPDFFPPYDLQNFTWSRLNLSGPIALLCGTMGTFTNGSFCIKLSVFEDGGRGQSWPHLLHTANSSQSEVWLDGMLSRADRSRFLLELQAVGGAYPPSKVETYETIDDEFTPSIFKVSRWVPVLNGSSDLPAFIQWKPVAYRLPHPTMEDSTPCRHSEPLRQSSEVVSASSRLIRAFYTDPEVFGLNVSFGLAGDPFYINTKFLSWTLLVGVGLPPVDSISPLVICMMAVGLGVPMVFLLLGGVYVCLRRRVATTNYEPIN